MENMVNKGNQFWENKKVLITGHTGFKGSWLTLILLNMGAEVWGYSLEPETKNSFFENLKLNQKEGNKFYKKFNHYIGNINNFEEISSYLSKCNPDIIFHLAAQTLVIEGYRNPLNTWNTNLMGTIKLLESLNNLKKECSLIVVTTDKVYLNKEWEYSYRENDMLGGFDPYSASKACVEIAISSWRASFTQRNANKKNFLSIASVRAGNVIGGGDWSKNRLVPDAINSLINKSSIPLRNPNYIRPWQYVLEPLRGYIILAEKLYASSKINNENNPFARAFNFGPSDNLDKSVLSLIKEILINWEGTYHIESNLNSFHESSRLNLSSDLANKLLGWKSILNFSESVKKTVSWYKKFYKGENCLDFSIEEINNYLNFIENNK